MSQAAPYSSRGFLLGRLAYVRRDLNEAIDLVKDDQLTWAPKEGMRTVAGMLAEIYSTEVQVLEAVRGGDTNFSQEYGRIKSLPTLAEIRAEGEKIRAATISYIETASGEELLGLVTIDPSWFESGGFGEVPRVDVLSGIPLHEWYHTGQLVSYLWTLGHDPYA